MAIALEFRDNIQFVVLEGKFSKVEESALRLKLDQKVSQGRNLLVFKLDRFLLSDAESLGYLQNLFSYFISLGAWVAISGLNEKQTGHFIQFYRAKCKAFATESDAIKWILEESQKPQAPNTGQINEDEVKKTEIKLLIQSYAKHFFERDVDPFRIAKLAQEYVLKPTADFVHAVRSLIIEKDKLEVEVQKKEAELVQTEKILLEFMRIRKMPVTESEIQSHMKQAESKTNESDKALAEIQSEIKKKEERLNEIRNQTQDYQSDWAKKLNQQDLNLKELKQKHEIATQEMNKREKEETDQLQSLKQAASATPATGTKPVT